MNASPANHSAILAAAYRAKAREAVEMASQARQDGQDAAHRGYLSEALFWRAHAEAVARKADEANQEVIQKMED